MICDYEYKNGNLIVSYFDKSGNLKLKYYPWKSPTKFISTSEDDPERHHKYVLWSGGAIKEIYTRYPNKYSVYNFIDDLPEEEQKTLFEYNEPNIFFIDIETEILDKKPMPHLAESKVLSISIVHKDKVVVLGFDTLTKEQIKSIETDINNNYGDMFDRSWEFKYIQYKNEYELLLNFFKLFVPKMPVMTGWNFIHYDWVFLVNRCRKIGIDPAISSFTNYLKPMRYTKKGEKQKDFSELPAHRVIIDYMEIFDKWDTSIKVKESIGLDFVASKVLNVKKVNYEGNLKLLYEKDIKKFMYYNAIDSILVQMIHEKSKLADILYGIATLSRTTVTSALSTLSVTEGILRKKFKEKKNIILIKNDNGGSSSVKGGWVKEPIRGMATYTACFDFSSLYPITIRQFNISADSYKGQKIKNTDYALFNGHQIEIDPTDIICKNGSVFKHDEGIVSQVMGEVYADRKRYKKIMMDKKMELERLKKELEELELELS